jgi:hypothetical protein
MTVANKMIVFALVAATGSGIQTARRVRSQRNRPPTIQSFTSSIAEIDYCPFVEGGSCSSAGTIVTLQVKASDRDNEKLTYKYSVTAGAIAGSGATVNWDLYKTPLGMQTAMVEVMDQRGGKASSIARVNVVVCGACDPPCPSLSVTCPTEVTQGNVVVFAATVSGVGPDEKLTYLWSHSNGKRLAGQEGPGLRINAIGLPGDVITATVRILGIDPSCSRQASCESRIVQPRRSVE